MMGRQFGTACVRMALTACLLVTLVPSLAAGAPTALDPFGIVDNVRSSVRKGGSDFLKGPQPTTRYYHFDVRYENYTVNCYTKPILTVNGQFPGPTIYANENDRIIVNVTNSSPESITIHFHGTRQEKSPWMDGVAYITQCPIKKDDYYVHDFVITRQKGTLLWHAHIGWMRATVHGAFITTPKDEPPYKAPFQEFPMVFAEWWNDDIKHLEESTLAKGSTFAVSDAGTVNGRAGPSYNCSDKEGITTLYAIRGKTYLLRLINAAVNAHLFFGVGGHKLKLVSADAEYLQQFSSQFVFLSPGQTVDVLLTADQLPGDYYMSVSGYGRDLAPPKVVKALLKYTVPSSLKKRAPVNPYLPHLKDTGAFQAFSGALRNYNVGGVPLTVNKNLFFTVGLSTRVCNNTKGDNCTSLLNGTYYGFSGNVNNYTLAETGLRTDLMDAMWNGIPGVYEDSFPSTPEHIFDWTRGPNLTNPQKVSWREAVARVVPIDFNDTVQIVLQDTNIWGAENHPFHLHGHNFYVLGQSYGNYDDVNDPTALNLWDPPLRNTVSVPTGGWAVIRLKANNPGMWLFHCHLDKHSSWGMMAVLHVKNATDAAHAMLSPPEHRPPC